MPRLLSALAAITLVAAAAADPAVAVAVPAASSMGMASEFPVGRCMAVPNSASDFDVNMRDLRYIAPVPCTDPSRDYRVVAQVMNVTQCGLETQNIYFTRDPLVLCTVQDYPAT